MGHNKWSPASSLDMPIKTSNMKYMIVVLAKDLTA